MTGTYRALRVYAQLAKPGIVLGNMIACTGGFALAARGNMDIALIAWTVLGAALVVAGACAANNVIDRDIDAVMTRTQSRPLVTKDITPRAALIFAASTIIAGLTLLALFANPLAAAVALFGTMVYVGLYSLWLKRSSVHGTLIGSLSGAAPPAIGYCAASGRFDFGAMLLMLLFALWQMPHSYAIALFRRDDYARVAIPLPPLRMGTAWARRHIAYYILAFTLTAVAMTASGYAGIGFLAVATISGAWWLFQALEDRGADERAWARRVFACSILAITALSVAMALPDI